MFESVFRYQHSVAGFFGAAGLRNDDAKRPVQVSSNGCQNPVHPVGVGIVKKMRLQLVRAGIAQCVGDELRSQS